jgi:RNA polymerase sigma-70 factor (ECF subfamily)
MLLPTPIDRAPLDWSGSTDASVVAAIASTRDRGAFSELFSRYCGRVRSFLLASGLAPGAADDLTQEILLEVWRRADRYDPARASVATWVFTIARSRRIDTLRRERAPVLEPEDLEHHPSPEQLVDRERSEALLRAALVGLPAEQMAVLQSAYFAGKSMSEIASEQQVPLGTVKSRARVAVERLRAALAEERS